MDRNFISAATDGEKIYWITESKGLGMCLDIDTNVVSYFDLSWKDINIKPYGNAILAIDKNDIYALSCYGKYCIVYNQISCKMSIINTDIKGIYAHSFCFAKKISEEEIAFLPYQSNAVKYINIKSGATREDVLKNGSDDENSGICFAGVDQIVNIKQVPLFDYDRNVIVQYDLMTGNTVCKSYDDSIKNPIYVSDTDNTFYVLTLSGNVYSIDKKTWNTECIYKYVCDNNKIAKPFSTIVVKCGVLWMLPWQEERILRINLADNSASVFYDNPDDLYYFDNIEMSKYSQVIFLDDNIYCSMHTGNYMFCIDKYGSGKYLNLIWPDEIDYAKQIMEIYGSVNEGEICLKSFIRLIS